MSAPRCFGSRANSSMVAALAREKQIVEQPLVLEDKRGQFMRQREDDVEVRHGQQLSRARRPAILRARSLWHLGQCRLRQELKEMA